MLLKNILFLGLAVLTAATPQLDARAGTGKSVSSKTGTKGKASPATCPNTNEISAGVTCPRVRFTAAQIEKAVKQAKAMKVKGKTGKGLHFPSKYKPSKEVKLKKVKSKGGKAKTGKAVKRSAEDADEGTALETGVMRILQARRARGGSGRTRTKPKKTKTRKPKTTKPKTTKPKTTKPKTTKPKTKKGKKKDECKAGPGKAKVGKGVWMFPILEKGVWKPGVHPEVNYIILDRKFNYVKTAEREPGSAEEFEVCVEKPQKKSGKTKSKTGKGKTV